MATKPLTQTTGRRKSAVSRARLRAGSGRVTVNGRAFEVYFPTTIHRNNATEALRITGTLATYDVDVDIARGGPAGQSAPCVWQLPDLSLLSTRRIVPR